jgi:Uma2 family endonuclease
MSVVPDLTRPLYTAADLERMTQDGREYELIRGELHAMAPPGAEHGRSTESLAARMTVHALDTELGVCFAAETGFLIERDPDTVLAPDWAFIAAARLPAVMPMGYMPLVPDAVLETRSPGDSKREVAAKMQRWVSVGAKVALDLDPRAQQLTVHRLGVPPEALGTDDVLALDDVLPGFSLPLRRVFPPPAPTETGSSRSAQ